VYRMRAAVDSSISVPVAPVAQGRLKFALQDGVDRLKGSGAYESEVDHPAPRNSS
jgi:hypothetical protein